jgi:hypothetical protein
MARDKYADSIWIQQALPEVGLRKLVSYYQLYELLDEDPPRERYLRHVDAIRSTFGEEVHSDIVPLVWVREGVASIIVQGHDFQRHVAGRAGDGVFADQPKLEECARATAGTAVAVRLEEEAA